LVPQLVEHAARYSPSGLTALLSAVKPYQTAPTRRAAIMQALLQGLRAGPGRIPDELKNQADGLANELCQSKDPAEVQIGLELCLGARLPSGFEIANRIAHTATMPEARRTQAIAVLMSLDARMGALNQVPSRLANVIAYSLANSPSGTEELLAAVEQKKVAPSVLLSTSVQSRILNHQRENFRRRYAALTHGLPPADVRLADLVRQRLARFEPARAKVEIGAKLFVQHCASCHQLNHQGTKIGPQLDGVGIRGPERLLEDILDPNRNVDPTFRATILVLKDGRTLTGLLLREEGNLIVVADAQGKEQKIDAMEIEARQLSAQSPMPANFDTQLSDLELQHLLAYLLTQRVKK
jgi:putative heme-binding domain-containing protein